LLDTETTGLNSPIFVVELAVQRMRGWEPESLPFRAYGIREDSVELVSVRVLNG